MLWGEVRTALHWMGAVTVALMLIAGFVFVCFIVAYDLAWVCRILFD